MWRLTVTHYIISDNKMVPFTQGRGLYLPTSHVLLKASESEIFESPSEFHVRTQGIHLVLAR